MIVKELIQKRTKNTKTYLKLDGSYEAHVFSRDVHFEDESGNLYNIETKLFDEGDFDLIEDAVSKEKVVDFRERKDKVKDKKNKNSLNRDLTDYHGLKVPFDCVIPRNFKRGYTIGKGNDKLAFKPIGASPSKGYLCTNKDNAIEYQDPWNDVDVCLELTDIGIKETIILKTNLAPYHFMFEVEGDLSDDLTAGVFKLQPAWLQDATGTKRDVNQEIRREGGKVYLDLIADVAGLVYPIEIDPTVTLQPDATAGIEATYQITGATGNNYGTQQAMNVGRDSVTVYRSALKFDLSSIPAGSSVSSATMSLYHSYHFDIAVPSTVNFYKITANWGELTITGTNEPTIDAALLTSLYIADYETYRSMDITLTTQMSRWISGLDANYGLSLRSSAEGGAENRVDFWSSDYTDSTKRPKLVVAYNSPPTAPTVTAPNGSETWNAQHTVTWNPSTDSDTAQASLQYQVQLTTDNGSAWNDIVSLTQAGVTSYPYDFTSKPESSLCKIRIRAFDGVIYGSWDESNGVFTIQHNQAPLAPINLSPSGGGYDRAQIIRFSWQHVDPNNSDPQSKFDLQWRQVGVTTWNTITQTTTNQYYDMPANTLPTGNIEWQVRTYDQQNISGQYSSQITLTTGDKPASPTITYPTNGAVIPIARPSIQWSSSGQTGYQLQVLNNISTVIYDSGDVTSVNKAQTIGIDLANSSSYTVKLRIKNSVGIWSDWVSSSVTVSYTPPAIPIVTVTSQNGYINIAIDNPTPTGSEPSVSNNDLYRRELGQSTWTKIKSGIANDGSYRDYAVASGVTYEYKVQVNGTNSTIRESIVYQEILTLRWLWLHDVTDPQGSALQLPCTLNKSQNKQYEAITRRFAGRKGLTVEFGEGEDFGFKVRLELTNKYLLLEALADRRATLCIRDSRGRKIFGYIPSLPETDQIYGNEVDLEIVALDYSEEV